MKIVSLNAWGGALYDALAEWLSDCDVDVLCLQEVTCTPRLEGWTRFTDGERALPQRANLSADIGSILPRHQRIFLTSDSGPVIDQYGHQHQQHFGIALFVHERFPIVSSRSDFVHGTYANHSHWPATNRPRVAHAARIIDTASNRAVTIAHMHGLRDAAGKADTPARSAQAERLAKLITEVRQEGDFVVACGDFNVLPDSTTFRVLSRDCGLVDLVGSTDTRTSRYEKPCRHADYMLVSVPETVVSFKAPPLPEVSDHRILALTI